MTNDKQHVHKSGEMQGNVSLERALEYFSEKKRPREFVNGRRNEIRSRWFQWKFTIFHVKIYLVSSRG